tara:strand:+ start:152 stop:325 length:174 start_codon:yes stop_codon:yes gene_type:complete
MGEELNIEKIINAVDQILSNKKKVNNQREFQKPKNKDLPFDTERIIEQAENSLKKRS